MLFSNEGTLADDIAYLEGFHDTDCPDQDKPRLRKHIDNLTRGAMGERFSTHVLNRHFGNAKGHALIHNLRIADGANGFAQFDHILLSASSRTISIFESKAYGGKLSCNAHDEWTVFYGAKRVEIPSPVQQARLQREALQHWLCVNQADKVFKEIAVFVLVDPRTTIDRKRVDDRHPVYRTDNFYEHWLRFAGTTPLQRLFSAGPNETELRQLSQRLVADHQTPDNNWLAYLGFKPQQLANPNGTSVRFQKPEKTPPARESIANPPEQPQQDAQDPDPRTSCNVSHWSHPNIKMTILPRGEIALKPLKSCSENDRNHLADLLKGKGKWNPRYQNWIIDAQKLDDLTPAFPAPIETQTP